MDNILEQTLAALSVRHTRSYVAKVYEDDPDRDNLLGVSRMLRLFGIESTGYMCDDVEMLFGEATPFIAAMGRSFSLVMSIDKEHALLKEPKGVRRIETREFLSEWTGAVLLLEKKADACEPDIENHIRNSRNELIKRVVMALSLFALVIMGGCNLVIQSGIGECLLFVLNIIATSICVLLLEKQIKGNSKLGDKVCSTFKKGGCDSILDSDAAKPFLSMSWSEIGLGYFMTNTLLMLIVPESIPFIAIIVLLSLPVSIWSLGYQAIRKKWCLLCVLVQLCVIMQCAVIISFGMIAITSQGFNLLWPLLVYSTVIITLHYGVRIHEIRNKEHSDLRRIRRIVTDSEVFEHLLKQQTHYEVSEQDSSIIIGNPGAPNTITLFSNPYCKPCSEAHGMIRDLLKRTQQYKVQYIFTSFDRYLARDSLFLISSFFSHPDSFASVLDGWFLERKTTTNRIDRQQRVTLDMTEFQREYSNHIRWARDNGIAATPTILVNGYKLPSWYSIVDLYYIDL